MANDINQIDQEMLEAIKEHYTNLGIESLPIKTYKEPIYFGKFENLDGSINNAYLVLKEGVPTYVIVGEKNNHPCEQEVKAEIPKQNADEMDEFVYEVLQNPHTNLVEKIDILMSHTCVSIARRLYSKKRK